ncbi:hypothetical protein CFP56_037709 [Quercus suber]|uniref:Uncharacterized protein n=1 Tax=Quercus suber TaxID=58331 RepID=A0AAW0LP69_QUESU
MCQPPQSSESAPVCKKIINGSDAHNIRPISRTDIRLGLLDLGTLRLELETLWVKWFQFLIAS